MLGQDLEHGCDWDKTSLDIGLQTEKAAETGTSVPFPCALRPAQASGFSLGLASGPQETDHVDDLPLLCGIEGPLGGKPKAEVVCARRLKKTRPGWCSKKLFLES